MFLIKLLITVNILINVNIVFSYPHSQWWELDEPITLLPNYSFIPRAKWNAFISKRISVDSHKPVSRIVVKHTNTPFCHRQLACERSVKKLQKQFMINGYPDIQYNFIIDPFGNVYDGLGWYASTEVYADQNRSIGLIGMENSKISPEQKQSIDALIKEALELKILNKNYKYIFKV